MCANSFSPALAKVLGSAARTELLAVLAERRHEWLTAAELCEQADVSRSGFHRDHKTVLLDFDLVDRRYEDDPQRHPEYTLADSEQADHLADLHYALRPRLASDDALAREPLVKFTQ